MRRIRQEIPVPDTCGCSEAIDLLLRQVPDEEEDEGDSDDNDEGTGDGYSE
jgi:hypothetical protein